MSGFGNINENETQPEGGGASLPPLPPRPPRGSRGRSPHIPESGDAVRHEVPLIVEVDAISEPSPQHFSHEDTNPREGESFSVEVEGVPVQHTPPRTTPFGQRPPTSATVVPQGSAENPVPATHRDGVASTSATPHREVSSATPVQSPSAAGTPVAPSPFDGFSEETMRSVDALLSYITDDTCTEVLLNGPNECSRKIQGTRYHAPDVRFHNADTYHAVLNRFVLPYCDTPDRIDGKHVIVEGQLELSIPPGRPPMYARVHIIAPPGVRNAKVTIAKKPRTSITVDMMVEGGSLSQNAADFLKAISRGHKTFVVSGPTGAGKSTMLQAMTYYFDPNDRVVVVEETPELQLPLGDVVYLKSTLELPGQDPSQVYSLGFWVKQANRMRMDRVIVGETRGAELAEWLIAANSGAEGSATTVHAETPRRTLDKMLSLASKSSTSVSEEQLRRDIAATVDIVVQLGLLNNKHHIVTAIEEVSNTIAQQTSQIQTNTIFKFDRETLTHVVAGRPSDGLVRSLSAQGIPVNHQWFQSGN